MITVEDLLGSGEVRQLRRSLSRGSERALLDEASALVTYVRAKALLDGIEERAGEAASERRWAIYHATLMKMVAERPATPTWILLLDNLET